MPRDIRDTVNHIKKWKEVAKQLDDPFLKFITEYIDLIPYYEQNMDTI